MNSQSKARIQPSTQTCTHEKLVNHILENPEEKTVKANVSEVYVKKNILRISGEQTQRRISERRSAVRTHPSSR
jgi:hypothetical protein